MPVCLTRAFILVFLCLSCSFAAPQSAINGQITDSEGAVISNAGVLIHWDSSSSGLGLTGIKQDVAVITDATGYYSANVPPGFYDVFVSAAAFTPVASKVRVKEGQTTTFSAKLNADPLVSKELGHEIYPRSK
jgi:hypothetical protein